MRDLIKYGIILTVICAISGVSLSYVYSKTSVIIEQRQAELALKAMSVVLPEATDFEPVPADEVLAAAGATKGIVEAYRGSSADGYTGAVVKVKSSGYGGTIVMLIGMDSFGVCQGLQIISQSETPGLGSLIKEEAFTAQFAGKQGTLATKKAGGDIDGVSGASISSKAVVDGVNKGFAFATTLLGL